MARIEKFGLHAASMVSAAPAVRHVVSPLPNTPAHKVLMQIAFGDQQVTDFAAEVEARTIGASVYRPALDKGRWPGKNNRAARYIPTITSFPFDGSALVWTEAVQDEHTAP